MTAKQELIVLPKAEIAAANRMAMVLATPEYKEEISKVTFHQSDFSNNFYGVDSNLTPGRKLRQAVLERDGKYRALAEAEYSLTKKQLDVRTWNNRKKKLNRDITTLIENSPHEEDVELKRIQIERMDLEIAKACKDVLLSEKLVKDALHDAEFYNGKVYQILKQYYGGDIANVDFAADEINHWTLHYKRIIESELRGSDHPSIGIGHLRSIMDLPLAIRQELLEFWRDICLELQIKYNGPKIDFSTLRHAAVTDKVNKELPVLTETNLMIVLLKRNDQEPVATDFNKLYIPKGVQFDINKHLLIVKGMKRDDARNHAIELMINAKGAKCHWLLFVDSDMLLPKNYLLMLFDEKATSKVRTGMSYLKTKPLVPAVTERCIGAAGLMIHHDVFVQLKFPWFKESDNGQTDDVLFTNKLKMHKIDPDVIVDSIMGHVDFKSGKIYPDNLDLTEYCTIDKGQIRGKKVDPVEKQYLSKGERKLYRYVLSRPEDKMIGSDCCKDLAYPVGVSTGRVRHLIMPNDLVDPVGMGRNTCIHEALNTDATYVYSNDDDTIPPKDIMVKLIKTMEEKKLDALGAQYFRKDGSNQGVPIVMKGNNGEGIRTSLDDKNNGLQEVYTLPMGSTMIRSGVFKAIAQKQHDEKKEICWFKKTDNLTEDSYFSTLARELGFKLFVDTDIICKHENRATGKVY